MPPAVLAVTAEGGQLRCACGSFGRHANHVDRSVLSRLIASRVVFRHRARARHRGIDKSDQRAKSATHHHRRLP
eukprot:scaffold15158_cov75-Phaeocystis_antarctica.AAC.1